MGGSGCPQRKDAARDLNYCLNCDDRTAVIPKTCRDRPNPAVDRRLGDVRRKHGADRRTLAYSGSGAILPSDGSGVDYPIETID